jgi:hypothetical protein
MRNSVILALQHEGVGKLYLEVLIQLAMCLELDDVKQLHLLH